MKYAIYCVENGTHWRRLYAFLDRDYALLNMRIMREQYYAKYRWRFFLMKEAVCGDVRD